MCIGALYQVHKVHTRHSAPTRLDAESGPMLIQE